MSTTPSPVALDTLGVLRVRGADARRFLQGQLSNDLERLTPERTLLAGLHNPQGRAVALLRLLMLADDDLFAILPRELVGPVLARLGKFVLRAKVKLADDSAAWQLEGLLGVQPGVLPPAGGVRREADAFIVRIGESAERGLRVRAAGTAPAAQAGAGSAWQLAAIAAGEPQVHARTSEAFVAQMLNLDLLDGIAFGKGCYTGQEVIARAHYRGRVKRRMQRFASTAPVALAPGDAGTLGDGRGFQVVEAAVRADGLTEFLAVANLASEGAAAEETAAARVEARALPLPYALPR